MKAMNWAILLLGTVSSSVVLGDPPKQVDDYQWAAGTWKCKGQASDPPHPFTATFTLTREMEGAAYVEKWVEDKSAQHTQPYSVTYLWTYDPKSNMYVRNGVDNSANRIAQSSSGWQNGVWTWETDGFRIPVTRDGTKRFHVMAELRKDGNWVKFAEAGCDK